LKLKGTILKLKPDPIFKSKWKGLHWSYNDVKLPSKKKGLSVNDVQTKRYNFAIGNLETNGKTVVVLSMAELKKGKEVMNFFLPIVL
jgi:hypothetical protein